MLLTAPLRALVDKAKEAVRRWCPLPLALCVQRWKTRAPRTFNEKVRYKMARDGSALATMFADKVLVRDYVRARVGSGALAGCYGAHTRADEILWSALPREFVLKVNHGSGGVIVVADVAGAGELPARGHAIGWSRYVVHPDLLDRTRAAELLDGWLGRAYGQGPGRRVERAYRGIARRIIVEEFLAGGFGGHRSLPEQVMVHCIHGEPAEFVLVHRRSDFGETGQRRYLPEEWAEGAREWNISSTDEQRIMDWSRCLARETDMVRVDWHLTARGVHFNELTNYPAAGEVPFTGHCSLPPQTLDLELGALWRVPKSYGAKNCG